MCTLESDAASARFCCRSSNHFLVPSKLKAEEKRCPQIMKPQRVASTRAWAQPSTPPPPIHTRALLFLAVWPPAPKTPGELTQDTQGPGTGAQRSTDFLPGNDARFIMEKFTTSLHSSSSFLDSGSGECGGSCLQYPPIACGPDPVPAGHVPCMKTPEGPPWRWCATYTSA